MGPGERGVGGVGGGWNMWHDSDLTFTTTQQTTSSSSNNSANLLVIFLSNNQRPLHLGVSALLKPRALIGSYRVLAFASAMREFRL